jgi:hypothetical protein
MYVNCFVIRTSFGALQNLINTLPNPNPAPNQDPNPMHSGQVESEF